MTSKTVAVIGSGVVGETLANGFLKHGYAVIRASRTPSKLDDWLNAASPKENASTDTFEGAAAGADIIVLCVLGSATEDALDMCGIDNLQNKFVIDATNPIDNAPPVDGVLQFFTGPNDSLMERLQKKAPDAKFVQAFSCVGNANFVNPIFEDGVRPTMFICGNDDKAKSDVTDILDQFGWETADMGTVTAARAIEPLCMLWCVKGFRENSWTHAFKLLTR